MAERRIARALRRAREEGRAAFIPYITAGDPSLEWTGRYLRALTDAGADIVELGVPFSDPIADGKVNQRAAERALAAGATLAKILDLVRSERARGCEAPIVLFTYYNPLLRMGLKSFAARAKEAGVDGVLVVDLPPEEAAVHGETLRGAGIDTVFLASPTTTEERLPRISAASSGFVYYVSRLGVTGERARLSETLAGELARVRRHVDKPVAVGFGISTPDQAGDVAALAGVDAVVVGSALVKFVEKHAPEEAGRLMAELARSLVSALKKSGGNARRP
ncbi:MAG: tryptophan synthase subunit alpha [Elusimicrobiota bacterium]